MPPALITSAEWIRKTDRSKWHGQSNKARGDALKSVDAYVKRYTDNPTPDDLEFLRTLLTQWMAGKMSNNQLDTIRDHQSAVTDLKRACDTATQLVEPIRWNNQYPGIYIGRDVYRGNAWVPGDFVATVKQSLNRLATKPVGLAMLQDISARCNGTLKKVVIEYSGAGSMAAPLTLVTNEERKKVQKTGLSAPLNVQLLMANPNLVARKVNHHFVGNSGASAVVTWNHNDPGLDGRPAYIALAHELVHAYHYVSGLCYRSATGTVADGLDSGIMEEEMRTVGILAYAGEVPSENAIRAEHNVALRAGYTAGISFAAVTQSVA